MQKKVLILTPFYPPNIGGAETFAEALAKESYKRAFVTVLTYQPFKGTAKSVEYKYGTIRRMNWLIRPKKWESTSILKFFITTPKMFLYGVWLTWIWEFDTVHALGLIAAIVGVLLKKIFKTKLIITLLSIYNRSIIIKWVLNQADVVFVESLYCKQKLFYDYGQMHRVKVFTHWVDTDKFNAINKPVNDVPVILFVGRNIKIKGKHVIECIESMFYGKNIKGRFVYVEDTPYENMPDIYRGADILVVPALYTDSPDRVVAEGGACGCAVITSDRGALPEQVKEFGISCPVSDFYCLLKRMVENKKILQAYQKKATEYARENYICKNAEDIIKEY